MKLIRKNDVLTLQIPPDIFFSFKETWIKDLQQLPIDKYANYIRKEMYPVFSGDEQSIWRKNAFSNKDLQDAINAYQAGENKKQGI